MFIKYIISILDVYSKNWSYDAIMNYMKSYYLNIDDDDIYIFEDYCRKWGIKGSKWYDGDWNFCDENNENKEQLESLHPPSFLAAFVIAKISA